jgi:hypothetical protein
MGDVPVLKFVIEDAHGAKFFFQTLREANSWATSNGYGLDTIRPLEPDESRAYSEMFEGYDSTASFSWTFLQRH